MKKLLIAALLISGYCFGQAADSDQVTTVAKNVPPGAQAPVYSVPNALVYICTTVIGQTCGTFTPIYMDAGLTLPIIQPIQADGQGRFSFYAAYGTYTKVIQSSAGIFLGAYPFTLGGSGGSGCGGYCVMTNPVANQTVTQPAGTTLQSTSTNGALNVALFPGSDIGAKMNAAQAALTNGCGKLFLPSGTYGPMTTKYVKPRCVDFNTDGSGNTFITMAITSGALLGTADIGTGNFAVNSGFTGWHGLSLINTATTGFGTSNTSIGLFLGGAPDGSFAPSGYFAQNQENSDIRLIGFNTGIMYGNNSFLIPCDHCTIQAGWDGVSSASGAANSGENNSFTNSVISNNLDTSFNNYAIGNMNLVNTSLDYNGDGTLTTIQTHATMIGTNLSMVNPHLEQYGCFYGSGTASIQMIWGEILCGGTGFTDPLMFSLGTKLKITGTNIFAQHAVTAIGAVTGGGAISIAFDDLWGNGNGLIAATVGSTNTALVDDHSFLPFVTNQGYTFSGNLSALAGGINGATIINARGLFTSLSANGQVSAYTPSSVVAEFSASTAYLSAVSNSSTPGPLILRGINSSGTGTTYATLNSTGITFAQSITVPSCTGCGGGGGSGLSGMTAGQIPIAATATTVTSSAPTVGVGAAPNGIFVAPTTPIVAGNFLISDSSHGVADGGRPPVALTGTAHIPIENAGDTNFVSVALSGDSSITSTGVMTNTGLNGVALSGLASGLLRNTTSTGVPSIETNAQLAAAIAPALQTLTNCNTSASYYYSPFSGTCIMASSSIANYYTATTFTGIGPTAFTPTHTFDVFDATASTGNTTVVFKIGAGQSSPILQLTQSVNNTTFGATGTLGVGLGISYIASASTSGNSLFGVPPIVADTGSLATARTTAYGTSGSPITLVATQPFPYNNPNAVQNKLQGYEIACYVNTVTAAASTSVSLFFTWTDNIGAKTSGPYVLATTATSNYMSVGPFLIYATAASGATNIGYYTTLSGTGQSYGTPACNAKEID